MPNYQSQNRRLLRELCLHPMTSMEIIRKIGTVNPTRNISELRGQGHDIVSEKREDGYNQFRLVRE